VAGENLGNGDGVKLKAGEAKQLAALIAAVARPRSPQEAALVEQWLKRLEGGR
jgi:hypothetical protein